MVLKTKYESHYNTKAKSNMNVLQFVAMFILTGHCFDGIFDLSLCHVNAPMFQLLVSSFSKPVILFLDCAPSTSFKSYQLNRMKMYSNNLHYSTQTHTYSVNLIQCLLFCFYDRIFQRYVTNGQEIIQFIWKTVLDLLTQSTWIEARKNRHEILLSSLRLKKRCNNVYVHLLSMTVCAWELPLFLQFLLFTVFSH